MERKDTIFNLCLAALLLLAASVLIWAGSSVIFAKADLSLGILTVLVVALAAFLKSRPLRLEFHLVLLNSLIILTAYRYEGDMAVFAAALTFAAAGTIAGIFRGEARYLEVLASTSIAAISTACAWQASVALFGSSEAVAQRHDIVSIVWFVSVATVSMFVGNGLCNFLLFKFGRRADPRLGFDSFLIDSSIVYGLSGILGGLAVSSLDEMSLYVIAGITAFFGLVYWTYQRYQFDIRKTAERARSSERIRAEFAEAKLQTLEQYVEDLETSSEALQESHENFRQAAYHDALTGLPNRNYFIDTLKQLLRQSRENSDMNFAILLLDLNRFKTINDSLGHSMGDRLIKNVAKRLSQMVRDEDTVARFSGDKFGIILIDLTMQNEATAFAERLATRVAEPYTLDGRQVFTNVKIGITYGNSKYEEAEDILRDADIAMYYAKDNDENFVIFDQKMHVRAMTRLQLETDLRFAIERNEFELYYQPIIGLASASLVGFEALVRWNHPQRGLVPPGEFIPISESTGLIVPMTIKILHSACSQVASWQRQWPNRRPLSVAVNLSGKHFAHPNLVDQISDVLMTTGIDPGSLKLELTESAVMDNAESAIAMLKQIKETGVQISIDDFGTGYSSLSYLHRFPIDLLKVDRSFVSAMESNSENGEIVRTIIALAKALNLKVVAEGIESIHQFHQLRILGCEYGQGYLFAKPLPVSEIESLIEDGTRWQNILPAARPKTIPRQSDATLFELNP